MQYLLQSTIYATLLYTVYLIFLRDRATHRWNRFFLLMSATLPFIIPFIRVPAFYDSVPATTVGAINTALPAINIFAQKQTVAPAAFNWAGAITITYLTVCLLFFSRSLLQYLSFLRFIKHREFELINGVKVFRDTNAGPGSFLNYIFLPGKEISPAVFDHELAHITLKHSADILYLRVLQSIFWPNLALYAILRELRIVHEFQADAYAVKNEQGYADALLNEIFSTRQFSLSHTFFFHPIKRRIMMLNKPERPAALRESKLKAIIFAVMLMAGFIYLQSCSHTEKATMPKTDTATAPHVYSYVDEMPAAGYDLRQYLSENIKYPEAARQQGIGGRVIVRFVVDVQGNVTNPSIMHSPDTLLSLEALRVVRQMPRWHPGKRSGVAVPVYFTLPIVVMLDGGDGPMDPNGLTKLENDTVTSLMHKAQNNIKDLNEEENHTLERLMEKMRVYSVATQQKH